jgi:hypothetical protein
MLDGALPGQHFRGCIVDIQQIVPKIALALAISVGCIAVNGSMVLLALTAFAFAH